MPTLQESLSIGASPKKVFSFLSDIDRVVTWMPHVVEARRTSEIEAGPGAELAMTVNAAGRTSQGTSRCIDADAPHRLIIESHLDVGITSTITFELVPEGRGTLLSATVDYRFRGLGRLLGGLFADRFARNDMKAALDTLKTQLEAKPARKPRRRSTPAPE